MSDSKLQYYCWMLPLRHHSVAVVCILCVLCTVVGSWVATSHEFLSSFWLPPSYF